MYWRRQLAPRTTGAGEKVNDTKRRFQIVKLEERIAPCGVKYRGRSYGYPGPCDCHKSGRWAC